MSTEYLDRAETEIARLYAETMEANAIINVQSNHIKQLHDDNARLTELLRSEGANRYWEGRWRDEFADNTRLRELLRGVVLEADRETNAFIAARAALAEQRG
jgi:hypothetical protein